MSIFCAPFSNRASLRSEMPSDDVDKRDCEGRSHVHVFIYSGG